VIANVAALVFDDATASDDGRRAAIFTTNVSRGVEGAKIPECHDEGARRRESRAGLPPADRLSAAESRPRLLCRRTTGRGLLVGRLRSRTATSRAPTSASGRRRRGRPTTARSQRTSYKGKSRTDWTDRARSRSSSGTPGTTGILPATLCRDGIISQGEECDGEALRRRVVRVARLREGQARVPSSATTTRAPAPRAATTRSTARKSATAATSASGLRVARLHGRHAHVLRQVQGHDDDLRPSFYVAGGGRRRPTAWANGA
jgi:hypothetical protein